MFWFSSNTSSPLQPSKCRVFQSLQSTKYIKFDGTIKYFFLAKKRKRKDGFNRDGVEPENVGGTVVLPYQMVNCIFPTCKPGHTKCQVFESRFAKADLAPLGSFKMESVWTPWAIVQPSGSAESFCQLIAGALRSTSDAHVSNL